MTLAVLPPSSGIAGEAQLGRAEFKAVAAIMMKEARIKLTDAKVTLVHARLSRRLRERGLASFADYLRLVDHDAAERAELVTALTTNHTHFFREAHHFDHFRAELLPRLKVSRQPVRIWSAGCSTGEEVYTIAMCLLGPDAAAAAWSQGRDIRLLATDIAAPVVEAAARGIYPSATVEAVPQGYRAAWMRETPAGYEMKDEVRALITARELNLFGKWPMRQSYDAIFCRNVMIYFDDDAKRELEARLVERLAPGGFLYIGHSERLIAPAKLGMRPCGQTIYQKTGGGAE